MQEAGPAHQTAHKILPWLVDKTPDPSSLPCSVGDAPPPLASPSPSFSLRCRSLPPPPLFLLTLLLPTAPPTVLSIASLHPHEVVRLRPLRSTVRQLTGVGSASDAGAGASGDGAAAAAGPFCLISLRFFLLPSGLLLFFTRRRGRPESFERLDALLMLVMNNLYANNFYRQFY